MFTFWVLLFHQSDRHMQTQAERTPRFRTWGLGGGTGSCVIVTCTGLEHSVAGLTAARQEDKRKNGFQCLTSWISIQWRFLAFEYKRWSLYTLVLFVACLFIQKNNCVLNVYLFFYKDFTVKLWNILTWRIRAHVVPRCTWSHFNPKSDCLLDKNCSFICTAHVSPNKPLISWINFTWFWWFCLLLSLLASQSCPVRLLWPHLS